MSSEYDIAIIGAGAAGIGAGRVLQKGGARFCLLEAKHRSGGRAWTDTQVFDGIPLDRGCHWLHGASTNPLTGFADAMGLAYDATFSFRDTPVVSGARDLPDGSTRARALVDRGLDLIAEAGAAGRDVAAADVVQGVAWGRWYGVFAHLIGLITGAVPERLSTLDYAHSDDSDEDYPVQDGLGALVQRLGAGLPIHLGTRVSHIDWTRSTLRLSTSRGTVRVQRVIVTVSTSVLAAGGIRFTPALPDSLAGALGSCALGCCEKVALLLDRRLQLEPAGRFIVVAGGTDAGSLPVSLFIQPFGRPVVIADLAGAYMPDALADGGPGLIDVATRAMVEVFGSGVRRRILGASATGWTADPDILGAYSYAKPGRAMDRRELARPVGDRICLAGEAVSTSAFATCHGAFQSGGRAAAKVLASLGLSEPATQG